MLLSENSFCECGQFRTLEIHRRRSFEPAGSLIRRRLAGPLQQIRSRTVALFICAVFLFASVAVAQSNAQAQTATKAQTLSNAEILKIDTHKKILSVRELPPPALTQDSNADDQRRRPDADRTGGPRQRGNGGG